MAGASERSNTIQEMRKGLARVAVYPALFINLAAGVFVAATGRNLELLIVDWLYRDGRLTDGQLYRIPYIARTFDNAFIVLAVLGLLVLFVVLEYHYTRMAQRGLLLQRFLRILGVQILSLGVMHVAIDLMVGLSVATVFSSALSWLELGIGSVLLAVTFLPERGKRVVQ